LEGKPVGIVVAANQTLFREGLCRLLEDQSDLKVVSGVESGRQALECVREMAPDIALVDVDLPDVSGVEVCRRIVGTGCGTRVILLSSCEEDANVVAALESGASSYMLKCSKAAELCGAIRLVCAGKAVLDLEAMSRAIRQFISRQCEVDSSPPLRPREREILRLAAGGASNRDIAFSLGISERTVQSHLLNVFRRWQVNSRTEAVFHALKAGVVTLEDLP